MSNYINEASKFMYDDDYIVESELDGYKASLVHRKKQLKSAMDRKDQEMIKYWTHMVQASNKAISMFNAWEQRKSDKAKSDPAAPPPTHKVEMDAAFSENKHKEAYLKSAKKHGVNVAMKKSIDGMYDVHVTGSQEALKKFIKKHHDDGSGSPEELNMIKKNK